MSNNAFVMSLPAGLNDARRWPWAGPVGIAVIASLLLSIIALARGEGPNRDGILYLDAAQAFLDGGWAASRGYFDWPWMSVLIAIVARGTSLSIEFTAFFICVLLMAGTCGVAVALVQCKAPQAAWAACLATLSMPGLNAYRTDIFREFGFWFFSLAAVLFALQWVERGGVRDQVLLFLAIVAAASFRLEALAFLPVILAWQWFALRGRQSLGRVAVLWGPPVLACLVGAFVVLWVGVAEGGRLAYYLSALDPVAKIETFRASSATLASEVLKNKYVMDEAGSILFFGLFSTIVIKFFEVFGVLSIPFLYGLGRDGVYRSLRDWQPQIWLAGLYLLVLIAFLTLNFFMVARYVVMLNLLLIPVVAVVIHKFVQRWPRWRIAGATLLVLLALANVVSLSPVKTQYRDSGEWLKANAPERHKVFVEDGRTGYFAGWGGRVTAGYDRQMALESAAFDYVVLDVRKHRARVEPELQRLGWTVVVAFRSKAGDEVIIVQRASGEEHDGSSER